MKRFHTCATADHQLCASSLRICGNPMKTVFGDMMSNSTSATTFNTAKRFGATGAGFQPRIPRVTPNIIPGRHPSLQCGLWWYRLFSLACSRLSTRTRWRK